MEEIKLYYIASYALATLEENEPAQHTKIDNIIFYEKRFYLAHIKESTREKYELEPEELILFVEEEGGLDDGEWIEDMNESTVVCIHPQTQEEVDGIEYLEDKGLDYFLAETAKMEYAVWQQHPLIL